MQYIQAIQSDINSVKLHLILAGAKAKIIDWGGRKMYDRYVLEFTMGEKVEGVVTSFAETNGQDVEDITVQWNKDLVMRTEEYSDFDYELTEHVSRTTYTWPVKTHGLNPKLNLLTNVILINSEDKDLRKKVSLEEFSLPVSRTLAVSKKNDGCDWASLTTHDWGILLSGLNPQT